MPYEVPAPAALRDALTRHPAVADFVVLGQDDGSALLVIASTAASAGEILRGLACDVPDACVVVPALARGGAGVDITAVASACAAGDRYRYTAPANRTERDLAAIWADELGLCRVGVDDDFLDLGGDSFDSIQIAAAATEAGIPVTASDVYRCGTVRALAASLARHVVERVPDGRPA